MGFIKQIEDYAKENGIPIMQKDGIEFLQNYIKENNVKHILEIGSAIGYSAIKMSEVNKEIKITTVERDEERYKLAKENIKDMNKQRQIDIILDDAFNIELEGKYDLIFIDAAKAQNIKFFEKFKKNLHKNGSIITDNLNFHGLTKNPETIKSKNLKALIRKINNYKNFLKENKEFKTKFIDIGDGISISRRKEGE